MHLHIPLLFGTLKVKTYRFLRTAEREAITRLWRVNGLYFIWVPK